MSFIRRFTEKFGFKPKKSGIPSPAIPNPETAPIIAPEIVAETEEETAWEAGMPQGLREAFAEDRDISLGSYGDGPKSIGTKYGNKYYSYTRRRNYLSVYKADAYVGNIDIQEDADAEFLAGLLEQDISEGLRAALTVQGEFFTKDFDHRRLGIEYRGKRFEFYRDSREYAKWAMNVYKLSGDFIASLDIRETSDVEFLEDLFSKDNYVEE